MGIWKVKPGRAFKTKKNEHLLPGELVKDTIENVKRQIQSVEPVDDDAKKTWEDFKKGVWSVRDPIPAGPEITKEDIKRDQDRSGGGQKNLQEELKEEVQASKEGENVEEESEESKESTEEKAEETSTEEAAGEKTEGTSAAPKAPPADKAIPGVTAKKSE